MRWPLVLNWLFHHWLCDDDGPTKDAINPKKVFMRLAHRTVNPIKIKPGSRRDWTCRLPDIVLSLATNWGRGIHGPELYLAAPHEVSPIGGKFQRLPRCPNRGVADGRVQKPVPYVDPQEVRQQQ
jgi:hypothetical protein